MNELKQNFMSGKRISANDFISLAQLSGYKLPKNAAKSILDNPASAYDWSDVKNGIKVNV